MKRITLIFHIEIEFVGSKFIYGERCFKSTSTFHHGNVFHDFKQIVIYIIFKYAEASMSFQAEIEARQEF